MSDVDDLFPPEQAAALNELLRDPDVSQIEINDHQNVFSTNSRGKCRLNIPVFKDQDAYLDWLDWLIKSTDVSGIKVRDFTTAPVIEGSFMVNPVAGSLHICMPEITRGEPITTIRKQPMSAISLQDMVAGSMLAPEMASLLAKGLQGRLNMLISGSSGTGKTTLARALSAFIDPDQRVVTVEEIAELRLGDRTRNAVSLMSANTFDEDGRPVRSTSTAQLVREALRMRADRIWIGEVRGPEAYALAKACTSGHDGGLSTIHADNAIGAVKTATTYVQEAGVPEATARELVHRAFHLIVHLELIRPGVRRVTEIMEIAPSAESSEPRRTSLFQYDPSSDSWHQANSPSERIKKVLLRNGTQL